MSTRRDTFFDIINGRTTAHLTSAWQHLIGYEYGSEVFAKATIDFVQRWDWDWVKINPRAVYYAEAWGSKYDPDNYDWVLPALIQPAITEPGDLAKIIPLTARDNPVLAEQIAAARAIKQAFPDRAVLQTLFSPLTVLLHLADLPSFPDFETAAFQRGLRQAVLLDEHTAASERALAAIATTLADYVTELLKPINQGGAGLDGIFYAVTGTASGSFLSAAQFAKFSTPYDQQVLAAAKSGAVVFHTCQADSHPDWFADWPISALQWDRFLPGNPGVGTNIGPTPIEGPQAALFGPDQDRAELVAELESVLQARQGQPFLLSPSCAVPVPADDDALTLLRQA